MKILVVDDNRENVELITDILDVGGHEILKAQDGPAALELAAAENPDLILLDINMPGMSGFEVCTRLKGDTKTASIPVIMLTAMSDVDSRVKGLAAGADDYLGKPFSPRELIARIERTRRTKAMTDDLRVVQERLRETFERFVDASVVQQLMQNPEQVQLGGKLQPVTVMFADLQGFSSVSERTDPQALLTLLNAYHEQMVKIILQYGGTIDKFLGDGLMALYNTPITQDDHIARAVKSALHIQDKLHWFHEKLRPEERMQINFGIHSGLAVVGNVGTERIMNFTAVGDTVNVAARLQQMASGGRIYVSEGVYQATNDFVVGRSRGELTVKGRQSPVTTYEISNSPIKD